MENNEIFVIIHGCYSDQEVIGYFTSQEMADKYCVTHDDCYSEKIGCFDDLPGEFRSAKPKYKYHFVFRKNDDNNFVLDLGCTNYKLYIADYLASNEINQNLVCGWISLDINIDECNFKKAEKIACDTFASFLESCDNKPTARSVLLFNTFLKKDELERIEKEKQEKIKKKELAELARLKAKYESNLVD